MVFGIVIPIQAVVVGGLTLFTLLVVQTLIGLRIIKVGRRQTKWHKWMGFAILAIAVGHGLVAMVATGFITLG